MITVPLSTLAVGLGLVMVCINLFGLLKPTQFTAMARQLPRSMTAGYVFVLCGTAWFIWNVQNETLADFESLKPYLFTLFILVGVGTCVYVRDFLGARGLAVILLLLAKLMVDSERWADSEWRVVIAVWAYVLVLAGMWWTVAPWKMRDFFNWMTANEKRVRIGSAVRCAFGVFVIVLGLTKF